MTLTLRERNKLAAMDEVRQVAFEMMSERGFANVTVEEIAAGSSVSPSTVYRHFGTKEALVLSTDRPRQFVERLRDDSSNRSGLEAFERAALKVWGADDSAGVEIDLAVANAALAETFERQLLDQRGEVAELFAQRRGKSSPATKDVALAAASTAVLATTLFSWRADDSTKPLAKLLTKSLSILTP